VKPTYDNIYAQPPDHYDATLSPEYIQQCYVPVRAAIERRLKPQSTSLLDICCGTGVVAELIHHLPGLTYLGLDINPVFLNRARERLAGAGRFFFLAADLLTVALDRKFDIVLMVNGYHHFPHSEKSRAIRKVRGLLAPGGAFVVYEMCIAGHRSREEFVRANQDFYRHRIEWVENNEPMTPKKLAAWENTRDLSVSAEDEYKVDYDYIMRDFSSNGFFIQQETRIWPPPAEPIFENPRVGDFLFVFQEDK
jgi:SAM-dependent methyltransferase